MTLARFPAGHFASHNNSPFRERWEILFAGSGKKPPPASTGVNPGGPEDSEKPGETGKPSQGPDTSLLGIQAETTTALEAAGGVELLPANVLETIERSPQILEVAVTVPDAADEVNDVAKNVGIDLANPPPGSSQELQERWEKLDATDKLLKLREAGILSADQQQSLTRALLARPGIALSCARELRHREERTEKVSELLQDFFQEADPTLLTLNERIRIATQQYEMRLAETQKLEGDPEKIQAAAEALDRELIQPLELETKTYLNTWNTPAVQDKIKNALLKHVARKKAQRNQEFTEEERQFILRSEYASLLHAAQKFLWTHNNAGGRFAEKSAEYLERMKREREAMCLYVDRQIQKSAKTSLRDFSERFARMIEALDIRELKRKKQKPQDIEREELLDAFQGAIASGQTELERMFLARHGISGQLLLLEFQKLRIAARLTERAAPLRCPLDPKLHPAAHTRENEPAPPPADAEAYLPYATHALEKWRDASEVIATDEDIKTHKLDQEQLEEWAWHTARQIENMPLLKEKDRTTWNQVLDAHFDMLGIPASERGQRIQELNASLESLKPWATARTIEDRRRLRLDPEACITPWGFPPVKQDDITRALGLASDPERAQQFLAEKRRLDGRVKDIFSESPQDAAINGVINSTRQRLTAALDALLPPREKRNERGEASRDLCPELQHSLSSTLNLHGKFIDMEKALRQELDRAQKNRSLHMIAFVRDEVQKLEQCAAMLREIEKPENIVEDPALDPKVPMEYDRETQKICIRPGFRNAREFPTKLYHERGHAILDILTRKTKLFPKLLPDTFKHHRTTIGSDGRTTFEQLLLSLQEHPSYRYITEQVPRLGPDEEREEMLEELLIRYAENASGRVDDGAFDPRELELFSILQREGVEAGQPADDSKEKLAQTGAFRQQSDLERRYMKRARTTDADAPVAQKEIFTMKGQLSEIDRKLINVRQFLVAYADPKTGFPAASHAMLQEYYGGANDEFKRLENVFLQIDRDMRNGILPEDRKENQDAIAHLDKYVEKLDGFVHEFDMKKLDTTKEKRKVGLWNTMTRGVTMISLFDVVKLWQNALEDFKQIYQRRQDKTLKDVGYALTKPLQDSNLLKGIPGIPWLNAYLPGLHAYHQRRYSSTDVEASDKWKDGMKFEDSHTLAHFLHLTRNRDAVRGVISLLCERGEMDWNDPGIWDTLNALSGFHMPAGPCSRNDVLRDTWLRKLVSHIWQDKELYYHWRQENDGKIKSGKESFTPWVDQLSNLRGGMEGELHKQLQLFEEWRTHGKPLGLTPPEDIKPHLYEKVIHYAISNGKMTMEMKFYYLIRGVASGILSIDRLRTLAGEEGGVLNQFPFIDYFYKKNNTLPEVQALALRLTERKEGKDTFKPGIKTTLWIQLELVRNKGVQERLNKGTSRTSAETIDHEDVPLFLPQLDYNSVREMANVISGSRQKMSPEARKNLYCGYSSKFKVFARLAQLEDERRVDRFTAEDAALFADAVTAYVDVDNIFTRRGFETDMRPALSKSQLESPPVSSDGTHNTMQYRRNLNRFVARLMAKLGDQMEQSAKWTEFKRQYKKQERKTRADGTVESDERNFSIWDYVREEASAEQNDMSANKKDTAEKLFHATKYFSEALKEVLPQNLSILKETLKEFVDKGEDAFFDEGGSHDAEGGITLDRAEEAVRAREDQRTYAMQLEAAHS